MKFSSLDVEAKEAINELLNVFNVNQLVHLNKIEMGNKISEYVDAIGQNGQEYVHFVYTQSIQTNPIAAINPPLWLLCSFLSNLMKTALKKHGYAHVDDKWEYIELAQDVVEQLE
jgi:hypothetical protein|tara:strand:+ start:265 stop:609 length:345 start_codon:yes stop_codon:yes gene_type:complete